jgi:hypothetical protein
MILVLVMSSIIANIFSILLRPPESAKAALNNLMKTRDYKNTLNE